MKKILVILSILIIPPIILAGAAGYRYRQVIYTPIDPSSTEQISFTIYPGDSGQAVAENLFNAGLTRSSSIARLYFYLQQRQNLLLQAGVYNLSLSLNVTQMFDIFMHGTFDTQLTIPEGLRLEEISQIVSQNLDFDIEKFFNSALPQRGYLFPDTYIVPQTIIASELIGFMTSNFDNKFTEKMHQDLQTQNLTLEEAVILASIVEREAKYDIDRPIIAGILIKRYLNNWPLEADATVQFAKASQTCIQGQECVWWPDNLTEADINLESAYNTRKNQGLPPTPICSPGTAALKAVTLPEDTPYWFYLSTPDGKTHYSTTYQEHLLKIGQYL